MAQWRVLQSNSPDCLQNNNTHVIYEPAFDSTFGDKPCWINPAKTLCIATQNIQRIKPIANDDKLQSGIATILSLQAGITCLTETKVEWRKYGYRQGYKDCFNKLYALSIQIFGSSSEIAS
jgi:hypothetical protein